MNAAAVSFAALLALSAGADCKGETTPMDTKCVLEIKLASPKIRLGQDVPLDIQLRNNGPTNLWVNRRLLHNNVHSPATMRELWVDVVGPDGQPLIFASHVRAGSAAAGDYGVLRPGQSLSRKLTLSNRYNFDKPGTYRITAHYQDGTTEVPRPPDGAPHLRDRISSSTATLEVLAP